MSHMPFLKEKESPKAPELNGAFVWRYGYENKRNNTLDEQVSDYENKRKTSPKPIVAWIKLLIATIMPIVVFLSWGLYTKSTIFKSDLARQFYQAYMIYSYENWRAEAFRNLLYAAWSCDDCQDLENADYCRKLALLFFDGVLHVHPEDPDKWHVVKADIMRRAGMFEYVLGEYQFARYREEILNRIIEFQLKKAALGDRNCYTEEDALEGQYGFLSCNY